MNAKGRKKARTRASARAQTKPKARTNASAAKKGAAVAGKGDWREAMLARMRGLIRAAVPELIEERKWRKPSNAMAGVPVWSHPIHGIVCTGEKYANVVKLTFAQGAKIPDPSRLFNASLTGTTRRAIDIHEGETVDAAAFKALVKAAVAANAPRPKKGRPRPADGATKRNAREQGVVLLSGGNPQIAKADGDAPVQAYIAAMSGGGPGWKRDIGERLDALIVRNVPGVRKAVKWNSPFYGIDGRGWFLSFHVFTRYVKVAFFRGGSLRPVPPGASKHEHVRYVDIHEGDFDEAQMAVWVKQAAALPGWIP